MRAGVERFIHVGSIAVYGFRHAPGAVLHEGLPYDEEPEPWNHYVREKVLSEKVVWSAHEAGRLRVTSFRPSVVIGPRDRNVVTRFMRMLALPVNGTIGVGTNRVPVVVAEDLADVLARAVTSVTAEGRAYNVSGTRTITQRELYRLYANAAGRRLMPLFAPYPMALAATRLLEGAYRLAGRAEEPPFATIGVPIFGRDLAVDASLVERELAFRPSRSYEDSVRASVEWYRAHEAR